MEPDNTASENERVDPSLWVDKFGDYLYRYAWSRLRDSNAAEEVVQETFLSGIRNYEQYSGRGAVQAWLLGILKRKIIDYVRKRSRDRLVSSHEDETDPTNQLFDAGGSWKSDAIPWSAAPDRDIQSAELTAIVNDCLSTLPQGQADVFMLSVMQGMDSDQICNELAITPSNLWVRMHRARLGLAKCVGSRWYAEDEVPDHVK